MLEKGNQASKRLNIALSAYACRPNMGSEPGVGWNTAIEMAKHEQVWVITRQDNCSFIEEEIGNRPCSNLRFIYCGLPRWLRVWCKPGMLIHYYLWQIAAYFTLKQLLPTIELDLIHHITYVRYSTPSFLAFLPVPFIWGSVGGGEAAPNPFWEDFGFQARLYEWGRSTIHWIGEHDPLTRLTAQRSALVRATTEDTANRLRKLSQVDVEVFPESALDPKEIDRLAQYPEPSVKPIRFISMARLLHWKGLHLGIRGFAEAELPENVEYWICGEGPEKASLEALASSLGVGEQVKLLGRLPRNQSLEKLSQCHALIHPSLHDSGGWVCIEAMAMGRPVVCLDLGGPSTQVIPAAGFKVPAKSPTQVVRDLALSLTSLARDAELRTRMGEAGRLRVRTHYSWEIRGQDLAKLYREIVDQSKERMSARVFSVKKSR